MNPIKLVVFVSSFVFSIVSFAQTVPAPEAAPAVADSAAELKAVHSNLQRILSLGGVHQDHQAIFNDQLNRLAQVTLQLGSTNAAAVQQDKFEAVMSDLRAVQRMLGSYLGAQEMERYALRQGTISIDPTVIVISAGLRNRLARMVRTESPGGLGGFLGRAGVRVNVDPSQKMMGEFNGLRAEFSGLIAQAKEMKPQSESLASIISWGRATRFYSPGQSWASAVSILEK